MVFTAKMSSYYGFRFFEMGKGHAPSRKRYALIFVVVALMHSPAVQGARPDVTGDIGKLSAAVENPAALLQDSHWPASKLMDRAPFPLTKGDTEDLAKEQKKEMWVKHFKNEDNAKFTIEARKMHKRHYRDAVQQWRKKIQSWQESNAADNADARLAGRLELAMLPTTHVQLPCNMSLFAANVALDQKCPESCPYWAEEIEMGRDVQAGCMFKCVTGDWCIKEDPERPEPDPENLFCRGCAVVGCKRCSTHDVDSCEICSEEFGWYNVGSLCYKAYIPFLNLWQSRAVIHLIFFFVALILTFVLAWYVHLLFRPVTNLDGLQRGLKFRERSKLRKHLPLPHHQRHHLTAAGSSSSFAQEHEEESSDPQRSNRILLPLNTNLCRHPVGGPGFSIHMNFQVYVIIWGTLVGLLWALVSYQSETRMWPGPLEDQSGTPRQQCAAIIWSFTEDKSMAQVRSIYLVFVYSCSTCFALWLAIKQRTRFEILRDQKPTMQNFAVMVTGIPRLSGFVKLEQSIKAAVCEQYSFLEADVIGVSVCWNYKQRLLKRWVDEALHQEAAVAQARRPSCSQWEADEVMKTRCPTLSRAFASWQEQWEKPYMYANTLVMETAFAAWRYALTRDAVEEEEEHKKEEERDDGTQSLRAGTAPEAVVDADSFQRVSTVRPRIPQPSAPTDVPAPFAWMDRFVGSALLQFPKQLDYAVHTGTDDLDVGWDTKVAALHHIESSNCAFVVFSTQEKRDQAVTAARGHPLKLKLFKNDVEQLSDVQRWRVKSADLCLQKAVGQPDTVIWEAFGLHRGMLVPRILYGVGVIICGIFLWVVFVYFPYASTLAKYPYRDNHTPPSFWSRNIFQIIVVLGNLAMYTLCMKVAGWIGFRHTDSKEACYMIMYFFACIINVILDMALNAFVTYESLMGQQAYDYGGGVMPEVPTVAARFQTSAAMTQLGQFMHGYCFPATFFLAFILEPIFSIWLPYHLSYLLVRTHPEIQGRNAEASLEVLTPMDLGRYPDILVNVALATLTLAFPQVYWVKTYLCLVLSHIYIYILDHYRAMRSVPSFNFASMVEDSWAQALLSVPCAMMLVIFLMSANCQPAKDMSPFCKEGSEAVKFYCVAFVTHVIVHIFLATTVARRLLSQGKQTPHYPYQNLARVTPCTWFSANPVHCLRSKYIYGDSRCPRPTGFWIRGKEHLLELDPDNGCYFQDVAADDEEAEEKAGDEADQSFFSMMSNTIYGEPKRK